MRQNRSFGQSKIEREKKGKADLNRAKWGWVDRSEGTQGRQS